MGYNISNFLSMHDENGSYNLVFVLNVISSSDNSCRLILQP